jgi:hypothetical protein
MPSTPESAQGKGDKTPDARAGSAWHLGLKYLKLREKGISQKSRTSKVSEGEV